MLTTLNNFQTENIFSISSEEELVQSFRIRDQKKLVLPLGLQYPMNVRSYFTWKESSGVYTYLVFKKPEWDLPKGAAFKRLNASGEQPAGGMCNWCHTYGSSEEIAMLSVTINANLSFSYILCHDLRCIEKIEEASTLSGRSPEKAIDQLYCRIGHFFEGMSQYQL
jgi:hypothetical protein